MTYKLQALITGNGEVLHHVSGGVQAGRQHVLQPGEVHHGYCATGEDELLNLLFWAVQVSLSP